MTRGSDEKGCAEEGGVSALFTMLERHKKELGFEYYSVSQTTLDQVFLAIVGKHEVEEEMYSEVVRKRIDGKWKNVMCL